MPFDVGMASLVASAVNIHHFILDGAIWKLRNSRIAGVLIRSNQVEPDVPGSRSGWLRGLVWCSAIAGLAVGLFELAERRIAYPAALERGELERAETALDRLARVGYDRAMLRHGLAKRYAGRGDLAAAAEQHRRGLNLNPDPAQWLQLARLEEKRAHIEEADAAYQQALALGVERPDRVHAAIARTARLRGASDRAIQHLREALRLNPGSRSYANELAWNLATAPDAELREPEEAILLAHTVVEASPTPDASALDTLAAAYAAAARFDEATATASRAANLAKAQGKEALHRDISGKLALYRERRPFVDVPPEN
jgi:spermidine synthase